MSLYKFKSSRCSPCNQSTQRRRKVYRCWVSSSPIKRAKHETWSTIMVELIIKMKTKFTSSNAERPMKGPMDSSHHRCQIFTNAQTPYATVGCANVSAILLVDNACKEFGTIDVQWPSHWPASFDRSESYTRVIDGQVRCITPESVAIWLKAVSAQTPWDWVT